MKKKIIQLIGIIFVIIFVVLAIIFSVYYSSTFSPNQMRNYCVEESELQSQNFTRIGTSSLQHYAFWISTDLHNPKRQEIFIFREAKFLNLFSLARYVFEHHNVSGAQQAVSNFAFTPKNLDGKKMPTKTMIFFSSNHDNITRYEIDFQENGRFGTIYGGVTVKEPFVFDFPNIGIKDQVIRVFEGITFYDFDKNVISN